MKLITGNIKVITVDGLNCPPCILLTAIFLKFGGKKSNSELFFLRFHLLDHMLDLLTFLILKVRKVFLKTFLFDNI